MTRPKLAAVTAGALALLLSACGSATAGNSIDDRLARSNVTATSDITLTGTTTAGAPRLTADDARRIARDRVGGGQVTQVEREVEHGRVEWKVRLSNAGRAYEVRVDAETGTITRFEPDSRRGGDDSGSDDKGGDDKGGDDKGGDR